MRANTNSATSRPIAFSLALGTLAGAGMIVTLMLTHRGPIVFIPYSVLVIVTAFYLKFGGVETFARRFGMALGAFMFASAIFYVFIFVFSGTATRHLTFLGHLWRVGLMLGIGSVLSAALAYLFRPGRQFEGATEGDRGSGASSS